MWIEDKKRTTEAQRTPREDNTEKKEWKKKTIRR
jgi:hypothetical protein